jgi:hypothetical protein
MKENPAHLADARDAQISTLVAGYEVGLSFPDQPADAQESEILEHPAFIQSTATIQNLFQAVKNLIREDSPPRYVHPKFCLAIRPSRKHPERVYIEIPKRDAMQVVCLWIHGHVWFDPDSLKWNLPDEWPAETPAAAFWYVERREEGTPFHGEKFEQFTRELTRNAPGPNRGAERISGSHRFLMEVGKEYLATDAEFHQLVGSFEFYNEVNNQPPLSQADLALLLNAAQEDICDENRR